MPNWCENVVTVNADTKGQIVKFMDYTKSLDGASQFSFNKMIPLPSELQGIRSPVQICTPDEYHEWIKEHQHTYSNGGRPITQAMSERFNKQYGTNNWYDWQTTHWGTKWDVDANEIQSEMDETTVKYTFDTAWGPPIEIYEHLVETFPNHDISWYYHEPNMAMAGYLGEN